ncbi:ABC transporter substrate-binding protein [Metallumcola ferriviriculae]|uniref:ABC transporter substrate-binding protein n=1 Tax=Metallumcola ferriviriculae TaxID=3039180 RepID=A0AAU0URW9_9FIRM|nr:ABC transporter substrate-binding protein [Desulfitibacteraceae bacterium MK1]
MILCLVLLVAAGAVVSGCTNQTQQQDTAGKNEDAQKDDADTPKEGDTKVQVGDKNINLGMVEWPGVTQKTYILKEVLDKLGYDVEINTYTVPLVIQGLSTGDIDAFAGTWFETFGEALQKKIDNGSIKVTSIQLEDALYKPAVPTYVFEAGVKSMADLNKYADKFNHKYYGIEPGNDGNQIMIDAVNNDTYNLGDWEVVESSTSGMLLQAKKLTDKKEWIVFSAWKPHWMNVVYDIKYLDDPEGLWGEAAKVGTISSADFPEEHPNVNKFLEQFTITSDIQSAWILEYAKNERDPKEVATEWVSNNLDLVSQWLDGVVTVDGKDAQNVIKESY